MLDIVKYDVLVPLNMEQIPTMFRSSSSTYDDVERNVSKTSDHDVDVHAGKAGNILYLIMVSTLLHAKRDRMNIAADPKLRQVLLLFGVGAAVRYFTWR